MKIVFTSTKSAARTAKRLRDILADISPLPTSFHFKDATAFVLGYDDWTAFEETAQSPDAKQTDLDERCSAEDLTLRRAYQANRLEEYARQRGIAVDGPSIIAQWKPSAARPQENTDSFVNAEKMRAEGRPTACLELVGHLERLGREPTLGEVEYIIDSLRSFVPPDRDGKVPTAARLTDRFDWMETFAGPIAVALVNQKEAPEAQLGFRLLAALTANGGVYAKFSLAHALFNGWGCVEDHHRARSLITEILGKLDAGELNLQQPSTYARLYSMAADQWMHGWGGPRDKAKAFELYRLSAHAGDGRSALIVAWFLMDQPTDLEANEYAGVVPSDQVLAERYFLVAVDAGYNPYTKQFDKVEVA